MQFLLVEGPALAILRNYHLGKGYDSHGGGPLGVKKGRGMGPSFG